MPLSTGERAAPNIIGTCPQLPATDTDFHIMGDVNENLLALRAVLDIERFVRNTTAFSDMWPMVASGATETDQLFTALPHGRNLPR